MRRGAGICTLKRVLSLYSLYEHSKDVKRKTVKQQNMTNDIIIIIMGWSL